MHRAGQPPGKVRPMPLRDRLRLLVVDDMSTSRGILLQALDGLGISNVVFEEDGTAGLSRAQEDKPHLVLSDFHMPGLNGLQMLQRIRTDPSTAGIGFILVTGRADAAVIDAGRKLGMNNLLQKPYTSAQLRDCIEAVVGPL